jgi:hypothetical protein
VFGEAIPPWVVALDELAWYADSLELPAQLAHYALVRERFVHHNVTVMDEGDWFRLYHSLGAVGSQRFIAEMYQLAESVLMHGGDLRRGRTLDGQPVWRSPLHGLLERLDRDRPPGWLETSFASST